MNKHRYNLVRNVEFRGRRFKTATPHLSKTRPTKVDLRPKLPEAFDQGDEGSCGPNSADAIMCFFHPEVQGGFSRQQIYYDVRLIEGTVGQDAGVETDDLFKVLTGSGAAPESLWPYTPSDFTTQPPKSVADAAVKYRLSSYSQLVSEEDFLNCLAEGFPFILGITVYQSLEGDQLAQTGVMQSPNTIVEAVLGGHDVTVVGYDTDFYNNPDFIQSGLGTWGVNSTALLIRNSWGTDWGINGHFWMPIDYASNSETGGDAWTGRL